MQGVGLQGFNMQGFNMQGFNMQGFNMQGFNMQGIGLQGFNMQGFNMQGFNMQGFNMQGFNMQGPLLLGIDRQRGMAGPMEYRGLQYGDVQTVPGSSLQGLAPTPSPPPINYVQLNPSPTGILQAGPGAAETGPGTFIYVDSGDASHTAKDLRGTFWNMLLADSTGQGAIGLYIADVAKDQASNQSKYPANDDIYLYTVYYRHPATGQWVSLCPVDTTGRAAAMVMPLDPSDWTTPTSRAKFTFACTATGVGAKCARNWGYKPWKTVTEKVWSVDSASFVDKAIPLEPFYDACLIAARADYCQDGQSYTKNGTMVDLFDTLDGFTSLNPTAGLPYAPNASGYMMHEEYEISALDLSTIDAPPPKAFYALTAAEIAGMSLSPEDAAALSVVRRSGMQSSRYDDLDPGRSCLAAPYTDRCDPHEPYACYREANMSANPYGAFLAVNSPRHCSHDELTDGEPLDPLCNTCVTRVCSVDPTCCGDPGGTYYPGSLVWDGRCSAIRNQVCKNLPSDPSAWNPGQVAPKAGSRPTSYHYGAVGSFEGISTSGTARFAEGWACDPDYPGASSTVQISVAPAAGQPGSLGAPSATLTTVRADQPLAPGWVAAAAAACGSTGRHGFRFQLPGASDGREVYVYGIDLDPPPAAPFTLLRGGKKVVPSAAAPATPRSAIWTGWVEPTTTGPHTFSADFGATVPDLYRLWVNGTYVAGNWLDTDPTVPGAFTTAAPASPPPQSLLKGVRYPVRIEYFCPSASTTSKLTLQWTPPGGSLADVPATALYPTERGVGNGLRGTYFAGGFGSTPDATQTWGAVDYVWTSCAPPATSCNKPAPGVPVDGAAGFAARFEGQVLPPASGRYLFSAESDGPVSIWVNGTLVNDTSRAPPSSGTGCTHDICRTGAAVSRTCDQGYFCAAQICLKDPACCSITWDAQCLQEVSTICQLECRQAAPAAVDLQAGVKYDIKVELQHPSARGARVQLYWTLSGGTRDKIPARNLFGEVAAPAPGVGIGLNAAYFSDATVPFKTEYLDRVEGPVKYADATLPTVGLSSAILCGTGLGLSACAADVLGPPALLDPGPSARAPGPDVTIKGAGATASANVTVVDSYTVGATTINTTYTTQALADGTFQVKLVAAPKVDHTVKVQQAAAGATTSDWSDPPLVFTVVDPVVSNALPAPALTTPTSALVATNGKVVVSGTALPGAQITVSGGTAAITTAAGSNNAWTATVTLASPGLYTLTITQSLNGQTGTATATARYALPPLVVTAPPVAETAFTGTVTVKGTATPNLTNSQVVVADGDGRYFVERASVTIGATAAFTIALPPLDAGRHQLKIFQRAGGLDGDPVMRSVLITPTGSPAVTAFTPADGDVIPSEVHVVGGPTAAPARTGLRYSVNVYQGAVKIGQGPVADDGSFDVLVWLSGYGPQPLGVALVASSLSGAGGAEISKVVHNVGVKAPPPVITTKNPVTQTTSSSVAVAGASIAKAVITCHLDGNLTTAAGTATAGTNGVFNVTITVPAGSHLVTCDQNPGANARSDQSGALLVSIGGVTPPKITSAVTDVPATTTGLTGTNVDYQAVAKVAATDASTSLPFTCVPPNNAFFTLGKTKVTCTATDPAGNSSSTTFTVTVSSQVKPILSGSNVVAEATGPGGAPVAYQVSATGFVASCAPPGSSAFVPCASWSPAGSGTGFAPTTVAVDQATGTVYASQQPDLRYLTTATAGKLYKSADRGKTWSVSSVPGTSSETARITFAPALGTTPATLYVPSLAGLLASTDGGATSKTILPGMAVGGVSVDPNNPRHLFAWNDVLAVPAPAALFESTDWGQTWSYAAADLPTNSAPGMPSPYIVGVAFDALHPGRVYTAIDAQGIFKDPTAPERIFRRITGASWQRLATPPIHYDVYHPDGGLGLGATPTAACGTGPTCFVTVLAGGLMSNDGGDSWLPVPTPLGKRLREVTFDGTKPGTVYGLAPNPVVSSDYGQTWQDLGLPSENYGALAVDPRAPGTVYATNQGDLPFLMSRSLNPATPWQLVSPGNVLKAASAFDLAFDPYDPQIAYLLANNGVFKTEDGGGTWTPRMTGLAASPDASQLIVDPFDRAKAYLGGGNNMVSMDVGTDGPGGWVSFPTFGVLAPDPVAPNVMFHAVPFASGEVIGSATGGRVFRSAAGADPDYALNNFPVLGQLYDFQVLPDSARTVAISYYTGGSLNPVPTTVLFSARDAQPSPAVTNLRTALSGALVRPVFDAGDGNESLFVGGDAVGQAASFLYQLPVSTLVPKKLGGGQAGLDFHRLAIDAGSAAQIMYTASDDDALWRSLDGGLTWAKDTSVPGYVQQLWVSPLDGALYAMTSPTPTTTGQRQQMITGPFGYSGTLWRKTANPTLPAGASVVEGKLRPTCVRKTDNKAIRSGGVFALGTTTLSCNATDVFGHSLATPYEITVTVVDTSPPVITVPKAADVTVTTTTNGPVQVPFTVTAKDAVEGAVTPVCNTPANNSFPLGVTTVTCTASDSGGHSSGASFPVTVLKQGATAMPPVLTLPGNMTVEATSASGAVANPPVSAKKSTGAALPQPVCTPAVNATFALGTTSVTCTTSDSGFTVKGSFLVTVVDTTPPKLDPLPAPSVGAQGGWGATVTFSATAKDLVDGAVTPVCTPASGSVFAIGTTPVSCRATDKTGNSAVATFNVVVRDLSPPVLTVPTLQVVEAMDFLGASVHYNVSATDNDGTPTVLCAPTSGSWFPLGDTSVSCQATDLVGNISLASFIVRVVDTTRPVLAQPATVKLEATTTSGAPYAFSFKGYDTVSGTLTPVCTRRGGVGAPTPFVSGASFAFGATQVTCTATDAAGNATSVTYNVVVSDTKGPTLKLPSPAPSGSADDSGTAVVSYTVTATDLPPATAAPGTPVPVSCAPASGSRFLIGTTIVTCSARDAAGNETRQTFNVVVSDTTPPVFSNVPAAPLVAYATTTAGAAVSYTLPTAADAISGNATVTCAPASGAAFAVGQTTVTCTAKDKVNNAGTATFTVSVRYDTRQPDGSTFIAGLKADGSSVYVGGYPVNVVFALTGASAPITNLVARATIAPVAADGTVGTFVDATPATGTGNLFVYDATGKTYAFALSTTASAPGVHRLHAELGDGVTREVNFTLIANPLTFGPASFTFPPTVIGQPGPIANFTLQNVSPVAVTPTTTLTPTSAGPGELTIVTNTCTGAINPGAICTIGVRFSPMSPGPKSASLTVAVGGFSATAMLSGIAWMPAQLQIGPPAGSLGSAPLLAPSPTVGDVMVTNLGDQPTGPLNVSLPSPDFSVLNDQCPAILNGRQTCHVFVRFVPTALGARGATLTISASPGGAGSVSLSGNGTPPLVVSPPALTFAGVTVGAAGASQVINVQNISAAPSGPLTTTVSPAAFRVTANTCAGMSLAGGSSCAVTIQWFPTVKGTTAGTLNVAGMTGWAGGATLTGTGL
jgi:hypothetical protein